MRKFGAPLTVLRWIARLLAPGPAMVILSEVRHWQRMVPPTAKRSSRLAPR
jgi:hypothetical protein